MSDYNIFGQPVILSSSKPNWADLAIERAAEIERLRAEIERLRAALEGVRTSVGQALDRIDRAPVPRTTGVNPVAREYLDQALAITREVLGDE